MPFYQQTEGRLGLLCGSGGVFFHRFSCSVLVCGSQRVGVCVCVYVFVPLCPCACMRLFVCVELHCWAPPLLGAHLVGFQPEPPPPPNMDIEMLQPCQGGSHGETQGHVGSCMWLSKWLHGATFGRRAFLFVSISSALVRLCICPCVSVCACRQTCV